MAWANLDDQFAEHPKNDALTDGAFRLHVAAICYANRLLTDGHIPADRVPRLVPRFRRATLVELIECGAWEHNGAGGFMIHDFLDWNRSRAQVEEERARKSRGGRKGAENRWHEPWQEP